MEYEFKMYPMQVEDHHFWVAESKCLKGCVGQGDTAEEALNELSANEQEWIATARECGIPIPEKTTKSPIVCSGKISLRVSPVVHEDAMETAKELDISLNQFINDAIISYISNVKSRLLKTSPKAIKSNNII